MDALITDHGQFTINGSFAPSITDCQQLIDSFNASRREYVQTSEQASRLLSNKQHESKSLFDNVNINLREIHKATQHHSKGFDRRLRPRQKQCTESGDNFSRKLLARAIAMHLLREGQFDVADRFMIETGETVRLDSEPCNSPSPTPCSLRNEFLAMYDILHQMRVCRNLTAAASWADLHSSRLQARGSSLEFELAKLQFLRHLTEATGTNTGLRERQIAAVLYARTSFSKFGSRYIHDVQQLMGAMTYGTDILHSPYRHLVRLASAWEELAVAFIREFCSLLGLSADSPLFIATTAGTMALPMLEKLRLIMKEKRTEWTTEHELPVEIPLPSSYRFHSVFVCPVSKEQTTDRNPPMLLPCGHVIARDSLNRLSKTSRFKCPYCPEESHHRDAREVML